MKQPLSDKNNIINEIVTHLNLSQIVYKHWYVFYPVIYAVISDIFLKKNVCNYQISRSVKVKLNYMKSTLQFISVIVNVQHCNITSCV